eukprot:scaffold4545_cov103-Alexandrium_tamarense.AAC.5
MGRECNLSHGALRAPIVCTGPIRFTEVAHLQHQNGPVRHPSNELSNASCTFTKLHSRGKDAEVASQVIQPREWRSQSESDKGRRTCGYQMEDTDVILTVFQMVSDVLSNRNTI